VAAGATDDHARCHLVLRLERLQEASQGFNAGMVMVFAMLFQLATRKL
jgi:hypothetical protein